MKYGYARVSTESQNLDVQVDALRTAGCVQIFAEKISALKNDRPQLDEMLSLLKPGDTVVVQSLDRLHRRLSSMFSLLEKFEKQEIKFECLDININTDTAQGRLFLSFVTLFSQMERDKNSERTRNSLQLAKARGKKLGRPRKLVNAREEVKTMYKAGINVERIAALQKVSVKTIYNILDLKAASNG